MRPSTTPGVAPTPVQQDLDSATSSLGPVPGHRRHGAEAWAAASRAKAPAASSGSGSAAAVSLRGGVVPTGGCGQRVRERLAGDAVAASKGAGAKTRAGPDAPSLARLRQLLHRGAAAPRRDRGGGSRAKKHLAVAIEALPVERVGKIRSADDPGRHFEAPLEPSGAHARLARRLRRRSPGRCGRRGSHGGRGGRWKPSTWRDCASCTMPGAVGLGGNSPSTRAAQQAAERKSSWQKDEEKPAQALHVRLGITSDSPGCAAPQNLGFIRHRTPLTWKMASREHARRARWSAARRR